MKLFITGAAGYIGGTFSLEAVNRDFDVYACDNFSNSSPHKIKILEQLAPKNYQFKKIDILDTPALSKTLKKFQPDIVIHFAALKSVNDSEANKEKYIKNNVNGTLSLISAMKEANVDKIIYSSSAAIYGNQLIQPVSELVEPKPISVYANTKLEAENIICAASQDSALNALSLRYFNPLGAHKEQIFYEDYTNSECNVLGKLARAYFGLDDYFKLFGDDFSTYDGTGIRDYIHIDDLVEGHFNAIEYLVSFNGYDVFNLGTNSGVSVRSLISQFSEIVHKNIKVKILKKRPFDISASYADSNKSNRILRWKAKKGIKDMCKSYMKVFQNDF